MEAIRGLDLAGKVSPLSWVSFPNDECRSVFVVMSVVVSRWGLCRDSQGAEGFGES